MPGLTIETISSIDAFTVSKDGALIGIVGGGSEIVMLNATDGTPLETSYVAGEFNPLPLLPHFTAIAFSLAP